MPSNFLLLLIVHSMSVNKVPLCYVSIFIDNKCLLSLVGSWNEHLSYKAFCRNGAVDDILLGFKNLAGNYDFIVNLCNSLSIGFICKLLVYHKSLNYPLK